MQLNQRFLRASPHHCSFGLAGSFLPVQRFGKLDVLRSRWRLCRLTDAACPLRVLSALYGSIQRQEGAGAPPHYPDVSLRGAKRRGNLAVHSWITGRPRRKRNCLPEIAPQGHFLALRAQGATSACGLLAMTNLGAEAFLTPACTSREYRAGSGMPLPNNARPEVVVLLIIN